MFNLFKKKKPSVLVKTTSKYPKEVEEIHHAFDTAAEKLLEEAKAVIDQSSDLNLEKITRLSALGFTQVKEVVQGQAKLNDVKFSKEQIELVEKYKKQYPQNKFITENQVIEICNKYGLVTAGTSCYKGFVPEKNLQDIEKFDEKYKCSEKQVYICEDGSHIDMTGTVIRRNRVLSEYFHFYNKYNESDSNHPKPISSGYAFQSKDSINFYGPGIVNNVFYDLTISQKKFNINNKAEPFLICAPLKDMSVEEQTLKNKVFFTPKLVKAEVPDPVVLHKVDGGFIVVTAWGDESHDPIIKD